MAETASRKLSSRTAGSELGPLHQVSCAGFHIVLPVRVPRQCMPMLPAARLHPVTQADSSTLALEVPRPRQALRRRRGRRRPRPRGRAAASASGCSARTAPARPPPSRSSRAERRRRRRRRGARAAGADDDDELRAAHRHPAPGDAAAREADRRARRDAVPQLLPARARRRTTCIALVGLEEKRNALRRQALGRPEAAARRSPARWSAIPSSCSSTSRRPGSTRSRGARCWEIVEASRRAAGRSCSRRTTWTRPRACATASPIVDHGKVIALGTPRELIASLGAEQ